MTELPERCPHRLAVAATVAGRLIGEGREWALPERVEARRIEKLK